jgi:hypothetical protein
MSPVQRVGGIGQSARSGGLEALQKELLSYFRVFVSPLWPFLLSVTYLVAIGRRLVGLVVLAISSADSRPACSHGLHEPLQS